MYFFKQDEHIKKSMTVFNTVLWQVAGGGETDEVEEECKNMEEDVSGLFWWISCPQFQGLCYQHAKTDICKIAKNTSHQSYSGTLINFEVCLRFAKHYSWLYISSRNTYEWWLRPCSSYWNTFRQIYI